MNHMSYVSHSPATWHCILYAFHLEQNVRPYVSQWRSNVDVKYHEIPNNKNVLENVVCTDRHGFMLKVGDVVGDYRTPMLRFTIDEIEMNDYGSHWPICFSLILLRLDDADTDDDDEWFHDGNVEDDVDDDMELELDHVADANMCHAVEQQTRASFCEVCDNHFKHDFVTWFEHKRMYYCKIAKKNRLVYSACRSCECHRRGS